MFGGTIGTGPNGGDTPSFANDMDRVAATRAVPRDEVTAMLKAAREWGLKLPNANGKSARPTQKVTNPMAKLKFHTSGKANSESHSLRPKRRAKRAQPSGSPTT